jgi:uncharacterized membrane protein
MDENKFLTLEAEAQIYNAKLSLFDSYVNRAWQRFNWLTTVMFAWISIFFSNYSKLNKNIEFLYLWAFTGLMLTSIWFFIGYKDSSSIKKYGKDVKNFENILLAKLDKEYLTSDKEDKKLRFRQTNWLYWLPILFVIAWMSILVIIYIFK